MSNPRAGFIFLVVGLVACASSPSRTAPDDRFACLEKSTEALAEAMGPPMVRVGLADIKGDEAAARAEAKRIAMDELEKGWTVLVIRFGHLLIPPDTRARDEVRLEGIFAPVFKAYRSGARVDDRKLCGIIVARATFDWSLVLKQLATRLGRAEAYDSVIERLRNHEARPPE